MTDERKRLVERAAEVLKAAGAREVYVFGSSARGSTVDGSYIDLAVSGLPPQVFFRAMGQAHKAIGRPLDLIDLDDETPFVQFIRQQGELALVG